MTIINKAVNYWNMPRAIKNPFRFGDPVDGDYYYPRPELAMAVRQFLENKIHVVLIGPRRFGKTSFILDIFNQFRTEGRASCLFVDIFNVTSLHDFLQQMVRALKSQKSWSRRLKEWVESIPKLRPKFSWEVDSSTGDSSFSLSPEFSSETDVKEMILDTLRACGAIGDRVVVAIDEFQTVADLDDGGWLEATLRTQMQQLKNTAFIFSGSRRSVIQEMLDGPARPFYRSCQPIEFPSFDHSFSEWIVERFRSVGVECEIAAVEELRRLVQDTPNYVQMACYHLVAQGATRVDKDSVGEVLRTIVKQNAYAYQTLLASLTPVQQRTLRMCAVEREGIFSRDLLARYELPSGPAIASAVKSLKHKQILDEGSAKGKVLFDDPLFAIWLRTVFGNG